MFRENDSKLLEIWSRLASSTTKKALVRRFDRETLCGFVNPGAYLLENGIELLTPSGTISLVPYLEVKTVSFVKEFDADSQPAKIFNTRPKMDGLWVRMTFRDGDIMDGILPNNLVHWERQGYSFVPPEPYSNNQKVFVPREALSSISVLGVVGSPLTKTKRQKVELKDQPTLFD
jgi:hypothetical protein